MRDIIIRSGWNLVSIVASVCSIRSWGEKQRVFNFKINRGPYMNVLCWNGKLFLVADFV